MTKASPPSSYPADLGSIRFNKCPPADPNDELKDESIKNFYPNGGVHKDVFPLVNSDYPLQRENLSLVKKQTTSDSVVARADIQLKGDLDDYFQNGMVTEDPETWAVITPLYPSDEAFWNGMREVVAARGVRGQMLYLQKDGSSPWPDLWYSSKNRNLSPWPKPNDDEKMLSLDDVAQSVRGEFSNYHQQVLLINLANDKVDKVGLASDIGSEVRSVKDFIGMQVRMAAINAWSFETVGPINFFLKWYFGVPRPEEVAWLVTTKKITVDDNVFLKGYADVIRNILAMDLKDATDFTAYPMEGSPTHPSFPAMHSAGSTCSLWVPVVYKLTKEQYLQTLRTDYGIAFARTTAGVHYPNDNLAGLNIGQRIIRDKLPTFLANKYGYGRNKVEMKAKVFSFDWSKFDVKDSTIERDGKKVKYWEYINERYSEAFKGEKYFDEA